MSDVLIQLCLKSAMVVIATTCTCIPVLLGAPITSLSEVQQPSNPLDIATCGQNSYWDIENAQCKPCVTCPMGWGSTVSECGDGNGEKGICEECDDGYYQDQTVTRGPCNHCSSCDSNRIVLTNCTKTTNTECGPCKEGYGQQPNHPDLCSACYLFNDDEKPLQCLTLTQTPLASVTDTDECLEGYVKDRLNECVDLNECDLPDSCDSSVSRCNNTDGSFKCQCLPGFEMNASSVCVDLNECDLPDSCDSSVSRCNNTDGSFTCQCLPGFEMNSSSVCVDLNECDLPDSCDSSVSRCNNTDGSFTCQCLPGFEMNSSSECVGKNIVVIGVPLGITLGLVLLLVVLVAIWLWRKKRKGTCKKVFTDDIEMATLPPEATHSPNDLGSGDRATSGSSVSLQAVTNSNRPSLTTAEAQRSGASEAVNDELKPLLPEETSPRGNISNHPPDTQGDDDGLIDADESAPAIGHTQTQGDEESDEVVEPNIDADDNSCPLSTEVSTQSDEARDKPGPMNQIGGNISNHPPDTQGDDDGDEVENADLIDADESAPAIGHTQTQGDEESDEVVEPNIDADDNSCPLSTEVSIQSDEARDKPGPMDQIGGEGRRSTPVRPSFIRSQSLPATSSTINENSRKEGKAAHLLPENTQKRLVEMGDQDKKEQFMKDFQKASRLGKDLQWPKFNLMFRNKVNQLMKTDNKEKDFKVFGELMGLNRHTELKDCSDLNSVFTQLEMSLDAEVFMDKVLQTLKDMKRYDVVREIVKEINNRKPTCEG